MLDVSYFTRRLLAAPAQTQKTAWLNTPAECPILRAFLHDLRPRKLATSRTQPLARGLTLNTHAIVVKPLKLAVIVIAPDHLPKGRTLAEAVKGVVFLALFVVIVRRDLGRGAAPSVARAVGARYRGWRG